MPDAIEKILVATDGSRNVERAIDYAVTIASISGAKLVGVYVVDHKYYEPLVKATSGRDVPTSISKDRNQTVHID